MNHQVVFQFDSRIDKPQLVRDVETIEITESGDLTGLIEGEVVFAIARGLWFGYRIVDSGENV